MVVASFRCSSMVPLLLPKLFITTNGGVSQIEAGALGRCCAARTSLIRACLCTRKVRVGPRGDLVTRR